jgi:oxaloacetate decarboxylase (Na+ extruding) subunit alpha
VEGPIHTDQYFSGKAKGMTDIGVDSICLIDASGLLTQERKKGLIGSFREGIGPETELEFISHCGTGLGEECYREALKSGLDAIITVSVPLAHGNSIPSTAEMLFIGQDLGLQTNLDENLVRKIDDYFFWVAYQENRPVGRKVEFDHSSYERYAAHQIPGGMMSHLVRQLRDLSLEHKLPEVLDEAGRVRQEIGYPVMVTLFSQFVGVQAVFYVIEEERYRTIPYELSLYERGHYGRLAAPIEPNILDRILSGGEKSPIDPTELFHQPMIDRFRSADSLDSDEDLLLSIFTASLTLSKWRKNRKAIDPHPVVKAPLAALVDELSRRGDITELSVQKGLLKLLQTF